MGMDGGLEILQLRSAEACSELRELLDPWLDEIEDLCRGKYGRDSRSLWVDGAEDDGRARAYRHAAELLRVEMEKGGM